MRAVCEACGRPQPPDWRAGDLCARCGAPVRAEVRCFWCARWTPAARFCRSCGAELVPAPLYGAARMLKDAGTDRFTVPKMLKELDPEQVENFSRIYGRHAAAVARHVDELRFLERFLFRKDFSAALEDELTAQLPWPEATLARFSGPAPAPGPELAVARAIEASTPLETTRALAALARLRLDDWEALEAARAAFGSPDPALRAEAALALTGWRVRAAVGRLDEDDRLLEALAGSPFRLEAAVRRALLGASEPDQLREALGAADRETAFAAALVLGDAERLEAALAGDEIEQTAAGRKLVALGGLRAVEGLVRRGAPGVQLALVAELAGREAPAPELTDALLEVMERAADDRLREYAARALCRGLSPEWAMRIARAARGQAAIFELLLSEAAALPPEAAAEVAGFMVAEGRFRMSQYGLPEAGERGAIPDAFVPAQFEAADAETRHELLGLAEKQLEARGDEALHRFVMNVVFGPYPGPTRAAAWWVLSRWYGRIRYGSYGPMAIRADAVERFFGSAGAFLPKLTAVLRDRATLKEVGLFEFLARIFKEADPSFAAALAAEEAAGRELVAALLEALRGDFWLYLRTDMADFLGKIGAHPAWRDQVVAGLERLSHDQCFDLSSACERALKRIAESGDGADPKTRDAET